MTSWQVHMKWWTTHHPTRNSVRVLCLSSHVPTAGRSHLSPFRLAVGAVCQSGSCAPRRLAVFPDTATSKTTPLPVSSCLTASPPCVPFHARPARTYPRIPTGRHLPAARLRMPHTNPVHTQVLAPSIPHLFALTYS